MDATSSDIRRLNKTKNDVFILIKIRHFQPGKTAHSYFALTSPSLQLTSYSIYAIYSLGRRRKEREAL